MWTNDAFFQGQARFCYGSNGAIYAVFVYNAQPNGCTLAEISVVMLSTCINPTSLIALLPTGPTGFVLYLNGFWVGTDFADFLFVK